MLGEYNLMLKNITILYYFRRTNAEKARQLGRSHGSSHAGERESPLRRVDLGESNQSDLVAESYANVPAAHDRLDHYTS